MSISFFLCGRAAAFPTTVVSPHLASTVLFLYILYISPHHFYDYYHRRLLRKEGAKEEGERKKKAYK